MKFMPTELTKFRGTTNALLGFIYREDGSSFPFSKNKVKKLINKNGKEITNETTLKEFEEKSYSYYKNNLYDKKASTSKQCFRLTSNLYLYVFAEIMFFAIITTTFTVDYKEITDLVQT